MWKQRKFILTLFLQKFRESNVFAKQVINKELISWNITTREIILTRVAEGGIISPGCNRNSYPGAYY